MSKYQIVKTTDGQFVGQIFDVAEPIPIVLNGSPFEPVRQIQLAEGMIQLSNSNYVIEAMKVPEQESSNG